MAIGNAVSYWYGTKAQYNAISVHSADMLYFIIDEQTIYKGDVRFAEGIEQLSKIGASAPSSPAKYDKYFNTNEGKIYVYNGTSWGNAYYPADGAMYYDQNMKRFVYFTATYTGTDVTGGSMSDVYDAGVSGDAAQGVSMTGASGSTVTVANASTTQKGVVKIGDNLNAVDGVISVPVAGNTSTHKGVVFIDTGATGSNGISLALNTNTGALTLTVTQAASGVYGTVALLTSFNPVYISVNASWWSQTEATKYATTMTAVRQYFTTAMTNSACGLSVDALQGHAVIADASTTQKGIIKLSTAAVGLTITNGILSLDDASTAKKGVVQIHPSISHMQVSSGVISVDEASTAQKGVIQIATSAEVTTGSDSSKAVVPSTLKTELDKKQDNMSATAPVEIDNSNVSLNIGDGLDVGVAGSTNANKLIVNEASVKEVLEDIVDGGTEPAVNEIVTADNLHGALSVGQAVDVSCSPQGSQAGYEVSVDGGTTWVSLASFKATNGFLSDFSVRLVNGNASALGSQWFGFYTGAPFPKTAPGLTYLLMFDARNIGTTCKRADFSPSGGAINIPGCSGNVPHDKTYETWTRIAVLFRGVGALFYFAPNVANTTIRLDIKNWRQYEVTALTDEAIKYLAHYGEDPVNPVSPDAFFRSTSAYSIRDKYLIKQDMVCPFIPTINMPDNSAGLTIGAGLSYQIKYTKTGTYSVSVDTIPADAYGWDAHISMFVKDTAVVQFQAPLILMDALTPNAGHNLSVKFRNGNALVYVDDTNAGTMVYLATGTTTTEGSLPYALSQTPPSEDATFTNFVVFSPVLGGTVCSMGTMSNVAYSASLIGNSDDETIIGGTIGMASGKYLAVQDVNLNDFVITSGSLNIGNNVKITGGVTGSGTGSIVLDDGCLLDFSDQTNNIPITGASISAVSGAKAIPYGEEKSEAISAGTGNAVNKYGKCGYLVSVASDTTASNTLYDALVGGGTPYSNIIFDPALDGQTMLIASSVGASITRNINIIGNGTTLTTIGNGPSGYSWTQYQTNLNVSDASLKGVLECRGNATFENIKFDGYPASSFNNNSVACCYMAGNPNKKLLVKNSEIKGVTYTGNAYGAVFWVGSVSGDEINLQNVEISGCTVGYGVIGAMFEDVTLYITGCTFTDNIGRNSSKYDIYFATRLINNSYIKNSYLEGDIYVGDSGHTSSFTIEDSTVKGDIITGSTVNLSGVDIFDGTVSGGGTVAFANGVTVTSTIPSGSTIGTGVISAKFVKSVRANPCTIENVSISGSTATGSLLAVGEGANVTLKNCVFADNALDYHDAPSGDQPYLIYLTSANSIAHLNNVTITSDNHALYGYNSGRLVYAIEGLLYVTDCYFDTVLSGAGVQNSNNGVLSYKGTIVFSGDNTTRINVSTASGVNAKYVITPNTIIRTNQESIGGCAGSIIYVGTYDENTKTVTTTGTATVVLNGTTVSISGSGTTIDSTGLHS